MVEADQANIVYKYKNIKLKMFKTNLNIKFNKKCLKAKITPNYINLKTNSKSRIAKLVLKKAQLLWLKLEIKEFGLRRLKGDTCNKKVRPTRNILGNF